MNARISECSVHAACGTSAGHSTASPAATRDRSSPTPTQPPPSMTMNQDVFAGVRLDRRFAGEGQLADRATAIVVDRLAGHPDRARRTIWPSMADAEPDDLDRHDGAPATPATLPARAAAAADRRLGIGELHGKEVALPGEALLVGAWQDRREPDEADPDQVPSPMISVASTRMKSKTKIASMMRRLNVISPVHQIHSHRSTYGWWRVKGAGAPLVEDEQHHQQHERRDPRGMEQVREVVG